MDQTLVINFCRPKVAFEISLTLHPTSKPLNLKEKGLVVKNYSNFCFKKNTRDRTQKFYNLDFSMILDVYSTVLRQTLDTSNSICDKR